MNCQNCGAELDSGMKFCTSCGQWVPEEVFTAAQATIVQAPVPEQLRVCSSCGAQVREGDKFCTECGHAIEDDLAKAAALASLGDSPTVSASGVHPAIHSTLPTTDTAYAATQQMNEADMPTSVIGGVAGQSQAVTQAMPYAAQTGAGSTAQMPAVAAGVAGAATNYQAPAEPAKKSKAPIVVGVLVVVIIAAIAAVVLLNPFGTQETSDSTAATETTVTDTQDTTADESTNATDETEEETTTTTDGDYVLADSSSRYYTETELADYSDYELYIARNEIYARYGRGFNNADLQTYFNSKDWYTQRYTASEFDAMESPLNSYEKANSELIRSVEESRNSSYL